MGDQAGGSVSVRVARGRDEYMDIWFGADPGAEPDGPTYTRSQHARNERALATFVDRLSAEARRARSRGALTDERERRLLHAFADFAITALGWERRHLEPLLSNGFGPSLRAFPALARQYDSTLTPADIYQAARNALTMYCLQRLLGVRVEPTPSVLGYSLLYPYTDNFLDDRSVSREAKRAFSDRLAARLAGSALAPRSRHEDRVFGLVAMIERQWPRALHVEVYESLLAIHRAQERSLSLLGGGTGLTERDIVEIGVEKGGTSVLADGYLVAGDLTAAQAGCLFGLGVFLQLRDDLEDVVEDAADGLRTAFSSREAGLLDDPTSRTLAIGASVIDRLSCFDAPDAGAVAALMARSLRLTIIDAAASMPSAYSPRYHQRLEAHSPFRLAVLAEQRRRLSRSHGSFTTLLETWLAHTAVPDRASSSAPVPEQVPSPWWRTLRGAARARGRLADHVAPDQQSA